MKSEDDFYIFIGKQIKNARKEQKLRQKDLSNLVGLTRTSIVNMEAGRQRVSLWNLFLISRILKNFDIKHFLDEFVFLQ